MDFTWGCDLLATLVYRALGLRAIPALLMACRVALGVISFWQGDGDGISGARCVFPQ